VFICLGLNGSFLSPTHQRRTLIEFYSGITTRTLELGTSLYYSGERVTDSLRLPVTQMFLGPSTVAMTIAATRMYHSLMDLGSSEM